MVEITVVTFSIYNGCRISNLPLNPLFLCGQIHPNLTWIYELNCYFLNNLGYLAEKDRGLGILKVIEKIFEITCAVKFEFCL